MDPSFIRQLVRMNCDRKKTYIFNCHSQIPESERADVRLHQNVLPARPVFRANGGLVSASSVAAECGACFFLAFPAIPCKILSVGRK